MIKDSTTGVAGDRPANLLGKTATLWGDALVLSGAGRETHQC